MHAPTDAYRDTRGEQTPRLSRLLAPADPVSAEEIVQEWGLWQRPALGRPHVMLNMIATADGRATVDGRSGALSDPADRALFHGLRSAVDAVLVGAATLRTERYGRIIPDLSRRQLRQQHGLSDEPLACIVSGRMTIAQDVPLLAEPAARVVVLTASQASLPATAAHVEYVRTERDGQLDLAAAIAELGERFGVQSVLCEGGPHLARQLLAAGLINELFLSVAPMLAGGEPAGGEALRILAGDELKPPVALELRSVLQSGSELFLRYGVCA
ncbi:MAG TPA: dihydrofolate reductase family protein [Solirubrobacteraceae bacterium]